MSDDRASRIEDELSHRELLLREAERIIHLGSWMWDTGTDAIRWSDELFRVFGFEPRSIAPTVEIFFAGIHPDDLELVQGVTQRGLETANPQPVDFRVVRPNGDVRHVHMEAALVKRDDSMLLVGSVLDITERLELESRLRHSQKMEAIGTLAGGVAHDFNNFLQVIFGHVGILLDTPMRSESTRTSLEQIRDAALRCQRLTQRLLTFSRKNVLVRTGHDLDALVDQIEPMLDTVVGDSVRVRRFRGRDPIRVECDAGSIEQVLMNLATNARDAMPRGGRLTIETDIAIVDEDTDQLRRGRYARISVEDEGVGIEPAVLSRVFEPYFTTKSSGHGTGLGLAMAWGIVEQSGGTILVTSEKGHGSVFRVMLPLVESSGDSVRPAGTPETTILLVEDQAQVRALVRSLLESDGYRVLEAEHGRDALRVFRDHADIALVLTDVSMPEMTGTELARALAAEPRQVPIVLMSGFLDASLEGLECPLLKKPFDHEQLARIIGEALE